MKTFFVVFFLLFAFTSQTYAQTCIITVPNNTPYPTDIEQNFRPRLTFQGFNNPSLSGGAGLKQFLEVLYCGLNFSNYTNETRIKDSYDLLLRQVQLSVSPSPSGYEEYTRNSQIFEYRVFEALISYLLQKNGKQISDLAGVPSGDHSHAAALQRMKQMATVPTVINSTSIVSDYTRWTISISNNARAWDLYLAPFPTSTPQQP